MCEKKPEYQHYTDQEGREIVEETCDDAVARRSILLRTLTYEHMTMAMSIP